jgi:HEAT repeat protein
MRALSDADSSSRALTVEALGKIGPPALEASSALQVATEDPEAEVRLRAALALWKVSGTTEIPVLTLIQLLGCDGVVFRSRVAQALGEIGPPAKEAMPDLIQVWRNLPSHDDAYAFSALQKIAPTEWAGKPPR